MMQYVEIARVSDVPDGGMKEFRLHGMVITLARVGDRYFAFDGICTHAYCSLAGGFLDGTRVTCYCHGAAFDVTTGDVLAPPATASLVVYRTQVRGENIFVEISSSVNHPKTSEGKKQV